MRTLRRQSKFKIKDPKSKKNVISNLISQISKYERDAPAIGSALMFLGQNTERRWKNSVPIDAVNIIAEGWRDAEVTKLGRT